MIFDTLMNEVFLDYLNWFITMFINNLLIFSKKREYRYMQLETVPEQLRENQLYISFQKRLFFKENTEFLGMLCAINIISPYLGKVR